VRAGDVVLPSGLNDGTAIAVTPAELRPNQFGRIIGRAWESSEDEAVKPVNVAVGTTSVLQNLQLEAMNSTLCREIEELKRDVAALNKKPTTA
jgi:hypothetical protein